MPGYPQFFSWIPIALTVIYFFRIVINWAKYAGVMVSAAGIWIGWSRFKPWPDGLLGSIADFSFAYNQEYKMNGLGYH